MHRHLLALVLVAAPALGAELSTFERRGAACVWRRVDPRARHAAVVAQLPGEGCDRAQAAWGPGGRAAVWLTGAQERPRLWLVELGTGARRALPPPESGWLSDLGFDAGGELWALTLEETPGASEAAQAPATPGVEAVARALRFDGQGWAEVERAPSTTSACGAPGVSVLAAASRLLPRTSSLVDPVELPGERVPQAELGILRSNAPLPEEEDGEWWRLESASPLYVWREVFGDAVFSTGRVALKEGGRVRALETGFTRSDAVSVDLADGVLLVSSFGSEARALDARTGSLLLDLGGQHGVSFWP